MLERELSKAYEELDQVESIDLTSTTKQMSERATLKLFVLSALVYLERASKQFSGQSPKIETWVARAFCIFSQMQTCNNPFPLFIIGAEATTDSRRQAIIEIVERTEQLGGMRSLACVRNLIKSIWVQDDLHIEQNLDYIRKLDFVLNSSDILPTLA